MRMARSSATSMMTASSGSRSQMNDTTHPSHAAVCCMEQSSQLMFSEVMGPSSQGGVTADDGEQLVHRDDVRSEVGGGVADAAVVGGYHDGA
jgi:hypothetical protein